jgi:hypothetical protein
MTHCKLFIDSWLPKSKWCNYFSSSQLDVPPLEDSKSTILAGLQQIRVWISELVHVDDVLVSSRTHQFLWMWTNLTPPEVIQRTYEVIPRSPTCLVDDISDQGCHSCMVHHDDWPPLVMVNKVSLPRTTLLTFFSFPHSHAFRNGSPWMIWDSHSFDMEKPNAYEREQAMKFHISTTTMQSIFEGTRRWILGQVMDLNSFTWIFNLVWA